MGLDLSNRVVQSFISSIAMKRTLGCDAVAASKLKIKNTELSSKRAVSRGFKVLKAN